MNRRRFVRTAPALWLFPLAGCLGDDDGETGPSEDTQETTGAGGQPPAAEISFPPATEPSEVPGDVQCGICNMHPGGFPDANAQAAYSSEDRTFFCSPGCAVSYLVAHDQLGEDADVVATWVRDADSTELLSVTEVTWVLNESPDRGPEPMRNPVPFADEADAAAYVEDWPDLEQSDIVSTDALPEDIPIRYREYYLDSA